VVASSALGSLHASRTSTPSARCPLWPAERGPSRRRVRRRRLCGVVRARAAGLVVVTVIERSRLAADHESPDRGSSRAHCSLSSWLLRKAPGPIRPRPGRYGSVLDGAAAAAQGPGRPGQAPAAAMWCP
jgi:hypothetical protein